MNFHLLDGHATNEQITKSVKKPLLLFLKAYTRLGRDKLNTNWKKKNVNKLQFYIVRNGVVFNLSF